MDKPEKVVGEYDRTRPELSSAQERAERLQGVIDAKGRRLPAGRLLLLLFVTVAIVWSAIIFYRILSH